MQYGPSRRTVLSLLLLAIPATAATVQTQAGGATIQGTARVFVSTFRQGPASSGELVLLRISHDLAARLAAVCAAHHRTLDSLVRVERELSRAFWAAPQDTERAASLRLRDYSVDERAEALYPATSATIDSLLSTAGVGSALIRPDGSFQFHGVQEGAYFIYGRKPKQAEGSVEHWWAPVIVTSAATVYRVLDGNETASALHCGAY